MAVKKITQKGDYTFNITSNSSDMTYVVSNLIAVGDITLNFVIKGEDKKYYNWLGDDLVISTIYGEKLVNTVIKNPPYSLKINGEGFVAKHNYADGLYSDKKAEDTAPVIGSTGTNTYQIENKNLSLKINDYGGSDYYNLMAEYEEENKFLTIHDYSGNDKYRMGETDVNITDNKGNDNYASKQANTVTITDKAGNDVYYAEQTANLNITDELGNDKYDLALVDGKSSSITDKKGNDSYNIVSTDDITITDEAGNDNYVVQYSESTKITDEAGNDKYNFKSVYAYEDNITITDNAGNDIYNFTDAWFDVDDVIEINDKKGNDKYNFAHAQGLIIKDGVTDDTKGGNDIYNFDASFGEVYDYAGKDKYNIKNYSKVEIHDQNTNTKTSSDTYSVKDHSCLKVTEWAGSDAYDFDSSCGTIEDYKGNDKYKITNSISNSDYLAGYYDEDPVLVTIIDRDGNDKYTISNSVTTINDWKGNDTYNISSSSDATITDYTKSNDTYNISDLSSVVKINDIGGGNDVLNLKNVNKNNLIYVADFTSDAGTTGKVNAKCLYIFDKTNNGYVKIDNFFDTNGTTIEHKDGKVVRSNGYIETIKAGKSNISKDILSAFEGTNLDSLSENVASWLKTNSYDSVSAMISDSINDSANITDFILTMAGVN